MSTDTDFELDEEFDIEEAPSMYGDDAEDILGGIERQRQLDGE